MVNYEVDPSLLRRYVPASTSLDSYQGKTYISLVGFQFRRTKLLGRFPVPFHFNFDEVNLRFYVRRKNDDEDRRGVVFIAEVVPRLAIAATARLMYGENYKRSPTKHCIESEEDFRSVEHRSVEFRSIEFRWRIGERWCRLFAQTRGAPTIPQDGSVEQFIAEHYWGYSKQGGGGCLEYHVAHDPWKVRTAECAGFEGDAEVLYGTQLAAILREQPVSAFVADGSAVTVFKGVRV